MPDRQTSPREIVELNIAHYKRLLETQLDATTRATIEKLLAEEKSKLGNLPAAKPTK
jgi:hypothetical protein